MLSLVNAATCTREQSTTKFAGLVCGAACQLIKMCVWVLEIVAIPHCFFILPSQSSFADNYLSIISVSHLSLSHTFSYSLSLSLSLSLSSFLLSFPSFTPIVPDPVNSLTVNGLNTQFSVQWREPTTTNGIVIYYYVLVYNAASTDRSFVVGHRVPGTSTSFVVVGLGE